MDYPSYDNGFGNEIYWDEPYDEYGDFEHEFDQEFGQDWYDDYYDDTEADYYHQDFDHDVYDMDEDQYEGYHQDYEHEGSDFDFDVENEPNNFGNHQYGDGSTFGESHPEIDENHEYQRQKRQNYCACGSEPTRLPRVRPTDHTYTEHPRLQIPESRSRMAIRAEEEHDVSASTVSKTQDQSPSDLFRTMFWKPAATSSLSNCGSPSSPRRPLAYAPPNGQATVTSTTAQPAKFERSPRHELSPWDGNIGFLAPQRD